VSLADQLPEFLPPQAVDAEMSTLGAALISRNAAEVMLALLDAADFYQGAHGKVFDAVAYLAGQDVPADTQTVSEELRRRGQLDQVGGPSYLVTLADSVPTAAHVEHYARTVAEMSTLRRLAEAGERITRMAHARDEETPAVVGTAERLIFEAAQRKGGSGEFQSAGQMAATALPFVTGEQEPEKGIKTGYPGLDWQLTGGWLNTLLYLLAGRPGSGKTAALCNFALNAAKAEVPVGIFSLEMSQQQLWRRLLALESRIDGKKLRRGTLTYEERLEVTRANARLGDLSLYLNDTRELSLTGLRGLARRLRRQKGIGIFFVDYLQLIQRDTKGEMDVRHFTQVAEGLKSMARDLECPVVALSQLSREVEKRNPPRPQPSDLRESGGLEQAADVVLLMYRENFYRRQKGETVVGPDETEFNISKWRDGEPGPVRLWYFPETLRFEEKARHYTDADAPPDYVLNGAGYE
jgi:replicative DNA helicase